jgi:hypothetical protein
MAASCGAAAGIGGVFVGDGLGLPLGLGLLFDGFGDGFPDGDGLGPLGDGEGDVDGDGLGLGWSFGNLGASKRYLLGSSLRAESVWVMNCRQIAPG